MRICAVAFDPTWKDPEANIAKVEQCVKEARELFPNVQTILFPELCFTGSVADDDTSKLAQPRDGRCVKEMQRIANTCHIHIVAGFIEKADSGKPFNTTFAVNNVGELIASYRKNHLYTGSNEQAFFEPGTESATFEIEGWKCGLACCFDIRFPRLFESYRRIGTELVLMGFNWFPGRNKPEIMDFLVKARAHDNQFFIAAADRSGSDPSGSFEGKNIIANPYGENVISATKGIYAYAEFKKEDMHVLRKALPLAT